MEFIISRQHMHVVFRQLIASIRFMASHRRRRSGLNLSFRSRALFLAPRKFRSNCLEDFSLVFMFYFIRLFLSLNLSLCFWRMSRIEWPYTVPLESMDIFVKSNQHNLIISINNMNEFQLHIVYLRPFYHHHIIEAWMYVIVFIGIFFSPTQPSNEFVLSCNPLDNPNIFDDWNSIHIRDVCAWKNKTLHLRLLFVQLLFPKHSDRSPAALDALHNNHKQVCDVHRNHMAVNDWFCMIEK